MDVQEPALFFKGSLNEGLYCRRKGKGYVTEVVIIITEKLPPDNIKDNLGEA